MDYDPETDLHRPLEHSEGEEIETIGSSRPIISDATTIASKRKATSPPSAEEKRRAPIWKHYTFDTIVGKDNEEVRQATCNYCNKKYKAPPKYGTSNATTHIEKCDAYKAYLVENPISSSPYDQRTFCKKFAEAIMFHAYPLRIVEHEKHRELLSYLNEQVCHITRNTILKYCIEEHDKLKSSLRIALANVEGRVCFTSDCWSSGVSSRGYLTLTLHYIDNNWILKSHILNFKYFPPPHSGTDIYYFVLGLIKDWKLEGKAFSMTCDNAGAMDVMVAYLKRDLHSFGGLPSNGRFFHVRCCAHILNLIVQAGMKVVDACVRKLRESINYIEGSESRMAVFYTCLENSNLLHVGGLIMDVPTRWNYTYLMMKRALALLPALLLYDDRDSSFRYSLTLEEWDIVRYTCDFLEPFHQITVLFSGSQYPTANLYFRNIIAIESLLLRGHKSSIQSIKDMASVMMKKFEKYWSDYSVVLSVAVLLDPRFKLKYVKNQLELLYVQREVEEKVKVVYDAFVELFKFYDKPSHSISHSSSNTASSEFSMTSMDQHFEAFNSSYGDAASDVDSYLTTPLIPRSQPDFDVLKYWQSVANVYPTLSRIAKDVLAIPITSVASESSFSMGARTLTKYRSSLLPKNVEAFVTTQNWLFGYLSEEEVDGSLEIVEEIVPNDDAELNSIPTE